MSEIIECPIKTPHIALAQLLKLAAVAGTGGEAKYLIQEGLVTVNGESEARRGAKMHPGDLIEVNGETIKVTQAE